MLHRQTKAKKRLRRLTSLHEAIHDLRISGVKMQRDAVEKLTEKYFKRLPVWKLLSEIT